MKVFCHMDLKREIFSSMIVPIFSYTHVSKVVKRQSIVVFTSIRSQLIQDNQGKSLNCLVKLFAVDLISCQDA